jgi:hypothetical protein
MDALINKVEILFWDRITPAISESRLIQSFVKRGYVLLHNKEIETTILWGIGAGTFGLITGLLISILSNAK